jgi:transcriptional regulator with XRE-family HTH domain
MANQDDKAFEAFDSFEEFFRQAEQRPGFWVERAKLEFTEEILARMKQIGLNRTQFAAKLDAQPALVTRLLNGRNNFELATMVRVARALDCDFRCHLQPMGTRTCWIDVLHEEPERKAADPAIWNPSDFRKAHRSTLPKDFCNETLATAA